MNFFFLYTFFILVLFAEHPSFTLINFLADGDWSPNSRQVLMFRAVNEVVLVAEAQNAPNGQVG